MGDIDAQHSISDSFLNSNWPEFTSGDTALFIRKNGILLSNSSNTSKHTYSIKFKLQPTKIIEFSSKISANINLSSSNYIEFGLIDSSKKCTFVRLGNTPDQLQFFINDSLKIVGAEQEFNVTKFQYLIEFTFDNQVFTLKVKNESNKVVKTYIFPFPNNQFEWIEGYYKIAQYGSTAIGKHSFEQLYIGEIRKDTSAPKLLLIKQVGNKEIQLKFNEPIQQFSQSNIKLSNLGINQIIAMQDSIGFSIYLNNSLKQSFDSLKVTLKNVSDVYGNRLLFLETFLPYIYIDTPDFGDILLTEIMINPSPSLGLLPEKKFIEIINNSEKNFNLNSMTLSDQISSVNLPDFLFKPKKILILINKNDSAEFKGIPYLGIPSFPSFNQDEDYVVLKSKLNRTIFKLHYTENFPKWEYRNGGYSLEKRNLTHGTSEIGNWTSNQQTGGSPGKLNLSDTNFVPQKLKIIESYYNNDSIFIRINQTVNPNKSYKLYVNDQKLTLGLKDNEILSGSIPETLNKFKKLKINQLNCNDSILIDEIVSNFSYKESDSGNKLDFNEILFHNFTGSPDFLELINNDSMAIFFNQYLLTIFNENGISIKQQIPLKNRERWMILPGEILAFCNEKQKIQEQFPDGNKEQILEFKSFPNFTSEMGYLELTQLKQWTTTVSKMKYNNNFHAPISSDNTGISLEKINPNLNSELATSWTSAVSSKHFGTPGEKNSTFFEDGDKPKSASFSLRSRRIFIYPQQINPLIIDFNLGKPGYLLNVSIFRKDGTLIEHRIQNERIPAAGSIPIFPIYKGIPLGTENYVLKLEAFLPNTDICNQIIRFSVFNQSTN